MADPPERLETGDDNAPGYEGESGSGVPRRIISMLVAEARVVTERSSRYLVQLCRHVNLLAQTRRRMNVHAEWSADHGVISFGSTRCMLRADPGVLILRAEAPDEESLHQIEQRVAGRLEQIGRRDRLTVAWTSHRST